MFIKYPSLTNHYQQKEINWWLEYAPQLATEKYLITEKIHGANIQLIFYPDGRLEIATRNRILDDNGNFYGVREILGENRYKQLLLDFFAYAREMNTSWALYGEVFGRGIQKGVDYGDSKQILFFAVREGKKWLAPYVFEPLIDNRLLVPQIAYVDSLIGTLRDEFLNLQTRLGSGIMEGVVIQPYERNVISPRGSHFIIKMKNEAFKEKASAPKVKIDDPEVVKFNKLFKSYITDMRLQSVFSKEGEIESPKDIGKYIRLVLEDAKEDFLKENDISELNKGQEKQVYNVGSMIANMLKGYL